MKVKVLRAFWYGGELRSIGVEVDLPDQLAREVVYGGKAERVKEAPKPAAPAPAAPPPAAPAKQPMTTKSAAALTGKKGD